MSQIPSILEMFKAGAHFGHQVSRRHPKMEPYIFTQKSGIHIIDLEKTQEKLKEALEFVKKVAANGGTILFLGTKKQAQPIIKKYAQASQMPYIIERWLGGTFTNFGEINKVINKFNQLRNNKKSGVLLKYTKKEQLQFDRTITKKERMVGGIDKLQKLPEAMFVVDIKKEVTAVNEANAKGVPIIAICDTNVNPGKIKYAIPANDDAIKTIEMITQLISEAVQEGLKTRESKKTDNDKKVDAVKIENKTLVKTKK